MLSGFRNFGRTVGYARRLGVSLVRSSRGSSSVEVTYYVALPFVAADDGIAAGEPTEFSRRAKGFSERPLAGRKSNKLAQN
jgi:hypothetical protein